MHPNIINPYGVIDTEFSSGSQHYLPLLQTFHFSYVALGYIQKVDTHGEVRKSAFSIVTGEARSIISYFRPVYLYEGMIYSFGKEVMEFDSTVLGLYTLKKNVLECVGFTNKS